MTSSITPTIYMRQNAAERIKTEILDDRRRGIETGGILVGRNIGTKDFFVYAASEPGPKADHNANMFEFDRGHSQTALNAYREDKDVKWIGHWHKHPTDFGRSPSEGDRLEWKDIVEDERTLDVFLPIIATRHGSEVKASAHFVNPDGSIESANIQIVPDDTLLADLIRYDDDPKKTSKIGQETIDTIDSSPIHSVTDNGGLIMKSGFEPSKTSTQEPSGSPENEGKIAQTSSELSASGSDDNTNLSEDITIVSPENGTTNSATKHKKYQKTPVWKRFIMLIKRIFS